MAVKLNDLGLAAQEAKQKIDSVIAEIKKVLVGQDVLVRSMLIALLADGHLLVEGVPGLAKTLAVTTLAKVISADFKRIQFTPDLLPADLIGTSIFNPQNATFSVKKGPIFTHILLADEINRAPAKVQSALLEVMQERQATIQGETFHTKEPYFVLATQNPIEQEGTYPLPEAQTDRFMMKVLLNYPNREEEKEIIKRMAMQQGKPTVDAKITAAEVLLVREIVDQIHCDERIMDYILDLIFSTRTPKGPIEGLLQFGASPRASIALKMAAQAHAFLEGRGYVDPYDIKSVAHAVLRHRLRRTYEAEAEEISPDAILDTILKSTKVP